MANYATLIAAIQEVVKTNGNNEITGALLQQSLVSIINSLGADYQFVGIAETSTNPGTPDQNVFYIAGAGTYSNFGAAVIPDGHLGALKYNGSWTLQTVFVGKNYDAVISGIQSEIGGITANMQASINILPLNKILATTGYIRKTNGTTIQSGGYGYTDFISVESGWNLSFNNNLLTGGTYGCSYLFYNADKEFLSAVSQNRFATVPVNARYVRLNLGDPALFESGGSLEGQNYALYRSSTLPSYYIPYGYEIKDDSITTSKLKNNSVTGAKIANKTITSENIAENYVKQKPGKNLLDPNATAANSYINGTDGTVRSGNYFVTDFIPVSESGLYCNKMQFSGETIGWAVYNSQKQYVRGRGGSGQSQQYTYQSGDAYIRYTLSTLTDAQIEIGTTGTPYEQFNPIGGYPFSIDYADLSPDMQSIETGKNKLNPNTVTNNAYINRTNGNVVSYTSATNPSSVTDFIPVSVDGLYFNRGTTFGENAGGAVYDSAKHYLRSVGSGGNKYTYQNGDGFVRFTFRTANLSTAQVEIGDHATEYEAYTERPIINPVYLPTPEEHDEPITQEVRIVLPNRLYAVVGDTLQIFFKSCIQAVEPLKYNVLVSCSKGRQYHRYFEYTPSASDVGTVNFRITVRDDNGNTLGTKLCSLVTVAAVAQPSSEKNVLCVGSSSTANGYWPAEMYRRLTGSGGTPAGKGYGNINFVGSMHRDGAGFYGKSGWGWVDFCTAGRPAFRFTIGSGPNVAMGNVYTNNGHSYTIIEISDDGTILCSTGSASNTPEASGNLVLSSGSGDATVPFTSVSQDSQNLFWDYQNNKLSFVNYANTYCNGRIDVIYTLIGVNGLSAWKTDFSDYLGYIKTFADTLHEEFPNAKLYLCCSNLPSMELMMPGYGASGSGFADTYGILVAMNNMREAYQSFVNEPDYSGFCGYVDMTSQFDGDYNYPITNKAVNTRNSTETEPYANNTVHAATAGYYQFADAVFRQFISQFCQ